MSIIEGLQRWLRRYSIMELIITALLIFLFAMLIVCSLAA